MTAPRLYLITDRRLCGGTDELVERVAAAVGEGGAPYGSVVVQLREKDLPADELAMLTVQLRGVCSASQSRLVVNGVDHVRDGGTAPTRGWWSVSTHSPEDALKRARAGAGAVLLGPIRETPSKAPYGPPLGVGALTEARRGWPMNTRGTVQLVALGGINGPDRAREAVRAGADAVAAIRAVLGASDPAAIAAALVAAVDEARAHG